ncbi:hypothetical protein OG897_27045 [Streptomyces sp. NBC_00237]|uniref:hypothetical protein n=1 Tax=Streptomyces sp. NBC_00237 TaxID=2975687 RepID=UPI00225249D7|nr:hypothetical protein [Streptomyces sp. NBC_00237]MCX5205100.1 hypothetical protein [Streptomyces sp. NBC_00237]
MGHTATLSAAVTVALCGVLTLGPAAVASPEARTAPAAASTTAVPALSPSVTQLGDQDREKLASTFQTVSKFGTASQQTGKLAGMVVKGEKDKTKLDKARKDSDKGLDNLLAIIPGGSPANYAGRAALSPADASTAAAFAAREGMKAAVALIKADTKALVEAALKADVSGFMKVGGTLVVHLGQLATSIFLEMGLGAVKDILPQPPKVSGFPSIPGFPGAEATTRH